MTRRHPTNACISYSDEICYMMVNFYAPDRQIFFFSDVPHLIKTTRSNLFMNGYGKPALLWNNGKELLWQHVSAIYAEEKTRQLRRTKLSNDHITLTGHSMMNVRLAAKVLSRSVRLVLQKYGADESQETARFILFMDRFLIV